MGIKGFQGTSLLDYPGKIASLVFFGGCNLTCPFCHNPALVLEPGQYPDYPLEALFEELQERRSFIDGVVVSGGEPTVDRGLLPLLRGIREMGLLAKLDTNGLAPEMLERAMAEGLLDYVALDLKTAPARYGELHDAPVAVTDLAASIELVLGGKIDYEIRSTCVPGFIEEGDVRQIGEAVRGAERWVLQQYRPEHALAPMARNLAPHTPERIRALAALAGEYVREISLRGL